MDKEKNVFYLLYQCNEPYLETATSKLVENTKAYEWTIIKELGKLAHETSG